MLKKRLTVVLFIFLFFSFNHGKSVDSAKTNLCSVHIIKGVAEKRVVKSNKWEMINQGYLLKKNDLLKTGRGSIAKITIGQNCSIVLKPESKIWVNYDYQNNSMLIRNCNLYEGEAFFVINEVATGQKHKINSLNSHIEAGISAFSITSLKDTTKCKVIRGMVNIKYKSKSGYTPVDAGYIVSVNGENKFLIPKPLEDSKIDELKNWVPDEIVDKQILLQNEKAKRDYTILTGRVENKFLAIELKNETNFVKKGNPGHIYLEAFLDQMDESYNIKGKIIDKGLSMDSLLKIAVAIDANMILSGTIAKLDVTKRTNIDITASYMNDVSIAKVCVKLKIFDIEEHMDIFEESHCEEYSYNITDETEPEYIKTLEFNLSNDKFTSSILGKTVQNSIKGISEKIAKKLY